MKKIIIFSLFILSCNSNIPTNSILNNNEKITDSSASNKFSSNYTKTMLSLKNNFFDNTKGKIRASHIDDANNTVIIFDDLMYYINPNGDIKTYDIKSKPYNSHNGVLYLDKGDGFGFFNPETGGSLYTTYVVNFKAFEPQEDIEYSDIQTSLLSIDNNKNGIGYSLSEDYKSINLYKVDKSLKLIPLNKKISLNGNEKFTQNYIFNEKNSGFIFSEENFNGINKNKVYLLKDNEIDVNKGINIDFKNIEKPYYISGKIDNNGDGFLYSQPTNGSSLELKKISNYKIEENSYLFKDIKNPDVFINNNGNGIIVSNTDQKTIYLYSLDKYNITKVNKIYSDRFASIKTNINKNGNGLIILSCYKNSDGSELPDYYSKVILFENYKISEQFLK